MLNLYDDRQAQLQRAQLDLGESEARRVRLETRVRELGEELDAALRQALPTLSVDQARHVYEFVWRYGCGQGDERAWAELVEACAHNDPSTVPMDISFLVMRASRSARVVHAAPDCKHLDVSRFPPALPPAAGSPGSSARALSADSASSGLASGASLVPSTSVSHFSAASVRRTIEFQRDGGDIDGVDYAGQVDTSEWGYDDDVAHHDERQGADGDQQSAVRIAPASASAATTESLRGVDARHPPVINLEDSASDASSDGTRTPRGVKRRHSLRKAAAACRRVAKSRQPRKIDVMLRRVFLL
ncbi:hypothetical protein P43SY_010432 [Pythium insidiosum]|uniref:Uncharacterized protein n=1 Tax=Pythium insidiosum TaxID=114742 RepID=A0AAD5L8L0_PYTIN|nr:hypothetical protein P43SY_010432 [Pythium insidiosum]